MNERKEQAQQEENTPLHLTGDSTLQTPAEDRHDRRQDPKKDSSISVSRDDLRPTEADRYAGSDRAGTAERKDNSASSQS